ncbi:MAG: pseudouridine synthase [Bacteroidales bacterium]|jgi:23S rRNA pseudouridine2605 synthase|nr:pseudouridine synthase [Bacteroidales bacterium]MDY0198197.1 pseudouridine synthase [Tenuifilaceae bacterium]
MRDNERFGKKPVRKSKSDEKESARVYKPRTASQPIIKSTEKNDDESFSKSEKEPKRTFRKGPDREESPRERGGQKKNAPLYKPRTTKVFEDDKNKEKPSPSKPMQRERKVEPKNESVQKSFYEDKFGKKAPIIKIKEEKHTKPVENKIIKKGKGTPTPVAPEFDNELKTDKEGNIRLNKYIANSGICSRREADEHITKGHITVNNKVVTELGTKVKLTDEVCFRGKQLDPEKKVYILLNKPKDYVTTVEDPNATQTVMELIQGACEQRVYPVGRLDRNSTGLLLFTNDGELTKRLTHPSYMKRKIYEVGLDKNVTIEDMNTIRTGVEIEEETVAADAVEYVDVNDKSVIGIEIHSGQNRIVRKIFEKLGYRVYKLDRVYFAGLTKKNLPRGKWRFLTPKEVNMLMMNRF